MIKTHLKEYLCHTQPVERNIQSCQKFPQRRQGQCIAGNKKLKKKDAIIPNQTKL